MAAGLMMEQAITADVEDSCEEGSSGSLQE